jgi:3',5'-cyclic AMP phosphodiesterase CpdA
MSRKFLLAGLFLVFAVYSAGAFSFAVFGDNHDGDRIFERLLDQLQADRELAFAVSVGDFADRGTEPEYLAYQRRIARLPFKVYQAPGNHDLMKSGYKYFQKYFGPSYYSFDRENAHFIVLNNAFKESFDATQFNWLKADLAANKRRPIFIFLHRPTFDVLELYQDYVMSGRQVTAELQKIFEKYKVAYVIAGHIHGYARTERGGVVYLVTGGAGGRLHLPLGLGGVHHYVKIRVSGDRITDQLIELKGD